MNATITELLIIAIISAIWSYLPVPNPLKLIGWICIGVAFIVRFLLPLLA